MKIEYWLLKKLTNWLYARSINRYSFDIKMIEFGLDESCWKGLYSSPFLFIQIWQGNKAKKLLDARYKERVSQFVDNRYIAGASDQWQKSTANKGLSDDRLAELAKMIIE